jgi:hypothetical protein
MKTQFSPPHLARKDEHDGHWRVYNADGGIEYEAECRDDAERAACDLDVHGYFCKLLAASEAESALLAPTQPVAADTRNITLIWDLLQLFGYSSLKISWIIGILSDRINLSSLHANADPIERNAYSLSTTQITEAAAYAAAAEAGCLPLVPDGDCFMDVNSYMDSLEEEDE